MPEAIIQVVQPGSAEDPFKPGGETPSAPAVTAAPPVPPVSSSDGTLTPPATATPPVVAPAPQTPPTAPATAEAAPALTTEQVQKMIEDATRSQQAGYDRRINVLNTQLEAERARAADAVRAHEVQLRELALSKDGLTPEDKQRLQEQWSVEDEKAKLAAWQQELEGFHGQLTVASLVEEFGAYGVKPEDLTDYDTPEEMEAHCLEAKANALEARLAAGVTAPPAQPAPAAPVAPAPAGVTQTSDVGGGGGAPHVPAEMNAEPGRDNLAANIAASGWSTVKLPY